MSLFCNSSIGGNKQFDYQKIVTISYADWKKQGFSKGNLQYMKKNTRSDKPKNLNNHAKERQN
jgi:hypothetical protein